MSHSGTNQRGRTLMEMMGVVVILGVITIGLTLGARVLSVFYQANVTAFEIEETNNRAWDLFNVSCDTLLLPNNELCFQDIFPQGCFNGQPIHRWGGFISIEPSATCDAFTITYTNIPEAVCKQICSALKDDFNINDADDCNCNNETIMKFTAR